MDKQIVECKPMKEIGFVVAGHSQFDDQVWSSLRDIADGYGLFDAKIIGGTYSNPKDLSDNLDLDHWLLLPTLLMAGATIIGQEANGEECDHYTAYIRNDDTIDAFCERMRKVRQFF